MRILLFGDGAWATNSLRRLVREDWLVVGIVARPKPRDPDLLTVAKKLQIPIFQPQKVNKPEFVSEIRSLQPSFNLSIFYDQILRHPILEMAPLGSINFHPGKLPYYRGRSVISWAMLNGETEIGLTAHYMDEGIDTGEIILQWTQLIDWTDTYSDVVQRIANILPDLVIETLGLVVNGKTQCYPQKHLPNTYFGSLEYEDTWIDWSDSSRNIYNKIRAITHPGIGARTYLRNQEVIIWDAFYDPSWPLYKGAVGQIVGQYRNEGVLVKTGDSTLLIREVQIVGGKIQTPAWRIGTRLGINLSSNLKQLQAKIESLE